MAELSDREAVKKIVPTLVQQGVQPDILLNCAGIQRRHPSEKFPDEDWDEVRLILNPESEQNTDPTIQGNQYQPYIGLHTRARIRRQSTIPRRLRIPQRSTRLSDQRSFPTLVPRWHHSAGICSIQRRSGTTDQSVIERVGRQGHQR